MTADKFLARPAALAAALVMTASAAVAQQPTPPGTIAFSGAIGADVHHQAYREPSLGVSENGWLGGLTLDGRMEYNLWQLRGEMLVDYGRMDYSGSGTANGIDDVEFEARGLIARVLPLDPQGDQLTPYVGLGYRLLSDQLGGKVTSTGAVGYDRLSQYEYLPIGIETLVGIAPGWSIKPTAEYDYFLHGTQDSYLSQVSRSLSDLHNTQHSGYGLRGSLMVRMAGATPIEFGPYVRYWNIKQSDTQPVAFRGVTIGSGFEPANHTTEAGLAVKPWF